MLYEEKSGNPGSEARLPRFFLLLFFFSRHFSERDDLQVFLATFTNGRRYKIVFFGLIYDRGSVTRFGEMSPIGSFYFSALGAFLCPKPPMTGTISSKNYNKYQNYTAFVNIFTYLE
jgi:hypothetical protein